jgi:lipopolysaccharide export LptBFGC system permease protein LptF
MLQVRLLSFYIFFFFIKKFILASVFGAFLALMIEFVYDPSSITLFNLLSSYNKSLPFLFFISSAWTLIAFNQSNELISFQSHKISLFKISLIFLTFVFLFSLFYVFVYNGLLLPLASKQNKVANATLGQFSIYNKTDECNYNIIIFNHLNRGEDGEFKFHRGEFASFKNCKFHEYRNLRSDIIQNQAGLVFLKESNIIINYQFSLLQNTYAEQVNKKSFKTFYHKIKLIREFENFNITNVELKQEVFDFIAQIISFFYMVLLSFAFFSLLPPRGMLFVRFFFSICTLMTIYLINLIITSWLIQTKILNPVIFFAFPALILLLLFTSALLKRV